MSNTDRFHIYLGLENGKTFTYKTKTSHEIYIRHEQYDSGEDRRWVVYTYNLSKQASDNMREIAHSFGANCVTDLYKDVFDVAAYFSNEKITSAVDFIEKMAIEAEFQFQRKDKQGLNNNGN